MQIFAVALENRMLFHLDDDVQIARRTAVETGLSFARQLEMRSGLHARRNGDLQFPFATNLTLAPAMGARPAHDLAAASTLRAGTPNLEEALLIDHLAAPVAHGARHQAIVLFRAGALAMRTHIHA